MRRWLLGPVREFVSLVCEPAEEVADDRAAVAGPDQFARALPEVSLYADGLAGRLLDVRHQLSTLVMTPEITACGVMTPGARVGVMTPGV